MSAPAYAPYDVPGYIGALRREGELLAAAAERAGMGAAVPSCPDWAVRDLLKHTGYVHRWAAGLDEAAPDLDCWAFLAAPSPLAFWARRQAHETAVHRADAEQAAAAATQGALDGPADGSAGLAGGPAFEPAFAANGVDELIMGFLARNISRGGWPGLDGSLAIHAADGADGAADWLVRGGSEAPGVSRGTGPAGCDVTGSARDLYLTLWNRRPLDGLQVHGDPSILAAFARALRITW